MVYIPCNIPGFYYPAVALPGADGSVGNTGVLSPFPFSSWLGEQSNLEFRVFPCPLPRSCTSAFPTTLLPLPVLLFQPHSSLELAALWVRGEIPLHREENFQISSQNSHLQQAVPLSDIALRAFFAHREKK